MSLAHAVWNKNAFRFSRKLHCGGMRADQRNYCQNPIRNDRELCGRCAASRLPEAKEARALRSGDRELQRYANLAKSNWAVVRIELARNPATPDSVFRDLSRDLDERVLATMARQLRTSDDLLIHLAQMGSGMVCHALAEREKLPFEAKRHIVTSSMNRNDISFCIRHDLFSEKEWEDCARHKDIKVRLATADQTGWIGRPNPIPDHVLRILAEDQSLKVVARVVGRISHPNVLHLAAKRWLKASQQSNIAKSDIFLNCLQNLVQNRNTAAGDLALLYRRAEAMGITHHKTLEYLAINPNLPASTLKAILSDNAGTDWLSIHAQQEIVKRWQDDPEVLRWLANSEYGTISEQVVTAPAAPADVLRQMSQHPGNYVRVNVARHRNTPTDVLAMMAFSNTEDGQAAAKSLKERRSGSG